MLDSPAESRDTAKLFASWNKIKDEAAADFLGSWLKERYVAKTDLPAIKNMDKTVNLLTDIEMQSVLQYCQSMDRGVLDIPVYLIQCLDETDATWVYELDVVNVTTTEDDEPSAFCLPRSLRRLSLTLDTEVHRKSPVKIQDHNMLSW